MAVTSDELIDGIKKRVTVPASQALITDADIMAIANTMIRGRMLPLVESLNQEYFVTSSETALVAGQSEYSIPYRAIGRKLRELKLIDDNDNIQNMAQIALEQAQIFQFSAPQLGFYYKGDKVVIVPELQDDVTPTQSLQMWWYSPPNALCAVSAAALVTSVAGTTVTCSSVPTTVSGAVAIDFIQGRSGNAIYDFDVVPSSTTSTTVVFASADDIPSSLVAGDYISAALTSPVINWLPNEAQPLLESYCAQRVCQRIGDFDGAKDIAEDIAAEEKALKLLLEPRIDGEPVIIINRSSLVRGNKCSQINWFARV